MSVLDLLIFKSYDNDTNYTWELKLCFFLTQYSVNNIRLLEESRGRTYACHIPTVEKRKVKCYQKYSLHMSSSASQDKSKIIIVKNYIWT